VTDCLQISREKPGKKKFEKKDTKQDKIHQISRKKQGIEIEEKGKKKEIAYRSRAEKKPEQRETKLKC
jgi:hypothetical protein